MRGDVIARSAAGEEGAASSRTDPALASSADRRIPALDGVRGLMTIFVVVSHYFAEVPGGVAALSLGWIAVDMFFVLSGFLIGRLVLDKMAHANFFPVFYIRRAFRLLPVYAVAVLGTALVMALIDRPWAAAGEPLPLWSYLTFTQNLLMVAEGHVGRHWLAPTWTLAVEEHFYLLTPALTVFAPRRFLVPLLVAAAVGAVCLRVAVHGFGLAGPLVSFVLLPGRADLLLCGVLAAVALRAPGLPWTRLDGALRVAPIAALLGILGLSAAGEAALLVWNPLLVGIGSAAFLLSLVRGAPEAARFHSPLLRFFGDKSYAIYLTHLPVLGLAHGVALNATPALGTAAQWLVTIAALGPCILIGWLLTVAIEEPLTRLGRSWRWSAERRPEAAAAPAVLAPVR